MSNNQRALRPILPLDMEDVLKNILPEAFRTQYQLLHNALPTEWHGRVALSAVEGNKWLLWVENAIDGQQFRFLLHSLTEALATHLPYRPQIVVRVNPRAFAIKFYQPAPFLFEKPKFNPAEGEEIVQKFLSATSWDDVF